MSEKKKFGIDFQKEVIRYIISDAAFYMNVNKFMKKEFFDSKYIGQIYDFIDKFTEKYSYLPGKAELLNKFLKNPICKNILRGIFEEQRPVKVEYIRDELTEFFKRNEFVRGHNKVVEVYNKGDVELALLKNQEMNDKINIINLNTNEHEYLLGGFDIRMHRRKMRSDSMDDFCIPTGIRKLDRSLNGGLRNGEFGLIIGDAKGGKSTLLRYFGLSAVKRYYSILHIQLEDSKQKVEDGYDAALLRQSYHDVRTGNIPKDAIDRVSKFAAKRVKKDLIIESFPEWDSCSIIDIDNLWYQLYLQGIHCKGVLIDYLELLKARRNYNDERHRQTSIAKDIKTFALKRNVAVWAPTQAFRNLQNEDQNFVITDKNVAEDYGKIRTCDIPISINSTADEQDENRARIHVCRGRVVRGGITIRIDTDLNNGLAYVNTKMKVK